MIGYILSPFWFGQGGLLAHSSSLIDPERSLKIKKRLIARYIDEEAAAAKGYISQGEWGQRRQYLLNRYIDLSRRYDYLNYIESLQDEGPRPQHAEP